MDAVRLAELLEPFLRAPHPSRAVHEEPASPEESAVLSPAQLSSISTYIDLLLRWNARINLTSIRDLQEIVTRHFGESLFVARHLFPTPGQVGTGVPVGRAGTCPAEPTAHLIDVGSGAGFPGLPIRIWAAQIRVTLIESSHKKVTFLREVARALTLTNVDVFAGRAADFPAKGSVVTLRAVERFDSILPIAASLVTDRGRLAVLVGGAQVKRVHELVRELKWADPLRLPLSSHRVLIIGSNESN